MPGPRRPVLPAGRGRPLRVFKAPAPSEGLIELHDYEKPIEFGLGQQSFRGEKLLLVLKHFVVARFPGIVALQRYLHGFIVSAHRAGLLYSDILVLLPGDEGVGYFLESVECCLLVTEQGFVPEPVTQVPLQCALVVPTLVPSFHVWLPRVELNVEIFLMSPLG